MNEPASRTLRWWQVALLAAALLLALGRSPFWPLLEGRAFDLLSTLNPPAPDPQVVVVSIDEPSFAELGLQWPWPRRLHGELLRQLQAGGARVVALDLIFAEESVHGAEDDGALAAAIADGGGRVVLAGDLASVDTPQLQQLSRIEPLPAFLAAGARTGLATVRVDGDDVLRRLPEGAASLARQTLARAGLAPAADPPDALLQYYGPPGRFPRASYYQALQADQLLPPDFFRGKLVLVGLDLHDAVDPRQRRTDTFATPWTPLTQLRTPGVEVHATALSNLLQAHAIRPLPEALVGSLVLLAALLSAWLTRRWEPLRSSLQGILLGGLVLAASLLLLLLPRLWLPPVQLLAALALPWLLQGSQAVLRERARRREISRAFSRYVSPALVERLQQNPEGLRLGGEVRELSILFLDIRGFTALSEAWRGDPQGLTRLLNRFMTPISEIILREEGTIDKYIGDCIMAFWNAPLDVPDHAFRACRAALAMLAAVDEFNAALATELQAAGKPPLALAVGIGINTGQCLVGNLGSELRFDYSALGDPVNLASRLEGASKEYGTPIVLGPDSAAAVQGRLATLELDLLAVKGRQEAVHVHALMGNKQLADDPAFAAARNARDALLAAYRQGDWDSARAALASVRGDGLTPRLAGLYEERIAALAARPLPAGWCGIHVAEHK